MATQAQIDYIKSLITSKKLENIPYMQQTFDETKYAEGDREIARQYFINNHRDWILAKLGWMKFEKPSYEEAVKMYNQMIADFEAIDLNTLDNKSASKLIDQLKRM